MHSSLIGKIEKAKLYAEEPSRARFNSFEVDFRGGHDVHHVSYDGEEMSCSCRYYAMYKVCSHTMAMQRLLAGMLERAEVEPSTVASE